jgi:hypothetical protein
MSPICRSPFAEMVATLEMAVFPRTSVERACSSWETKSMARSMPFLMWVGLRPASTFLKPYS